MTYFIQVDHRQLEKTAEAIDQYVQKHQYIMRQANNEVEELSNAWSGEDYVQFQMMWQNLSIEGSTSERMLSSLKNYAEYLRVASQKYKKAQSEAINRANRLCK